jgi:hypothetical protein
MSRSRRKAIAVKESDQEMTLTSEAPSEAIDVGASPQLMTEPDSHSSEMQPSGEELLVSPESEEGRDQVESMQPDSLAARWLLEHKSVLRELHRAVVRHIIFYTKPEGGGLSMEEAITKATRIMDGPEAEDFYKTLTSRSIKSISWLEIDRLFRYDPASAQQLWEDMKEQADLDFKSGHFAAQVFERADWQQDPWRRAHFIAVRDSFIEQFKPQGGIDYSMIDMLAVTFALWMHWTEVHMYRCTTEARIAPSKKEREYMEKYEGVWIPPRVREQDAIDHAAQMADRWRRAYQATLRQMRDWRRYSVPVTINNPRQVNIAADGGQQINVEGDIARKDDRAVSDSKFPVLSTSCQRSIAEWQEGGAIEDRQLVDDSTEKAQVDA